MAMRVQDNKLEAIIELLSQEFPFRLLDFKFLNHH